MSIDSASFDTIRNLVREKAAIVLEDGKEYLVEARLKPVCRETGHATIADLAKALRTRPADLVTMVVEALTTNETSFFRDVHPFDMLRDEVLPDLIERRKATRELNIWCAASSSGQEPLTLAIVIRNNFPELASWKIKILATDINQKMIERCQGGIYSQLEVARGLPAKLLIKYFSKQGTRWKANDEVLGMIEYKQMNLMSRFPPMTPMDVVFIRNVLIYFDSDTKAKIIAGVRSTLKPDGHLFLGTAESLLGLSSDFKQQTFTRGACYQPIG